MFSRMISHFAGDKPRARSIRNDNNAGLNSAYVRLLSRTYTDVYGR